MARTLVAASAHVAAFAARQPRVAVGAAGLGGIVMLELLAMVLGGGIA